MLRPIRFAALTLLTAAAVGCSHKQYSTYTTYEPCHECQQHGDSLYGQAPAMPHPEPSLTPVPHGGWSAPPPAPGAEEIPGPPGAHNYAPEPIRPTSWETAGAWLKSKLPARRMMNASY